MQRGVLLLGGFGPSANYLKSLVENKDLICAADSGLEMAFAAGITPDFILGDMDSLSDASLLEHFAADSIERFPKDKDYSDAELGLSWLRSHECGNILMIGGGEGRLDHTLALLRMFDAPLPPKRWITAREEILLIEDSSELPCREGSPASLYPVGSGPWFLRLKGLQWPVDALNWEAGMSLSNRCTARCLTVESISGAFLLIRPLDPVDSEEVRRQDFLR